MRAAEGKGKNAESRIGFRVLEASSSDDGFEASALEHAHPQSQGWQSARFCDYPVSLILELERSSELRQLQILSHESKIATRIELFVGEKSSDLHRLGFLSLDANERSQYRARELKSVYIRTKARYIQLLLHRNHANPSNLFSQVGLVAINVLGTRFDPAGPSDLAIDMSLDPRTAVLLRELHAAKLRAVELENYDEAKRLKLAIERVRNTGSELARLEAQKLKAVEAEDYDQAKLLKMQMDRLREHTTFAEQQSHGQGQVPGRGHTHVAAAVSEGRVSPPLRSPSPQQSPPRQSQLGQYEYGRAGSQQSYYAAAAASHASSASGSPTTAAFGAFNYDERPLPALQSSGAPLDTNPFGHRTGSVLSHVSPLDEEASADDKSLPPLPALSESNRTAAAELLQAFGEEVVAGLYSKKIWQHRANAIERIESQLITYYHKPGISTGDKSASLLVLALSALGPLISDSMVNVSTRALSALQRIVEQVTPAIPPPDALAAIEPLVPALVARMDAASGRLKEKALSCMVSVVSSPALGAHCVWKHVLRPLKVVSAPRPLLARMELLSELLPRSSVEDTMQRLDPLVKSLLLPALKHRNGAVRETAVQLAVLVHAQVHGSLLPLLEGLNPKLMSSLNKAFNENGGSRPRSNAAPLRKEVESHPPLSNSRAGNGAAPHPSSTEHQQDFDEDDNDNEFDEDGAFDPTLCRFCGMQDESFVHEENLDLHYWRTCPMLVSCKLCEQVVEIPTLSDHLLAECEAKADVQVCPQCQEPFSNTDIQLHTRTDNCHRMSAPVTALQL